MRNRRIFLLECPFVLQNMDWQSQFSRSVASKMKRRIVSTASGFRVLLFCALHATTANILERKLNFNLNSLSTECCKLIMQSTCLNQSHCRSAKFATGSREQIKDSLLADHYNSVIFFFVPITELILQENSKLKYNFIYYSN